MPNEDDEAKDAASNAASTGTTSGAASTGAATTATQASAASTASQATQASAAKDDPGRYAGPEYRRLLDAARFSLERTGGDLTRVVTVKSPDDRERRAIIGITGQYRPEGVGLLAVNLSDLDHAAREATGQGLAALLEQLGPRLRDRPAERLRLSGGREAALRSAEKSALSSRNWYQAWLAELAADGTLTRLVNTDDGAQLGLATRVLEWTERRNDLKAAPAQLTDLAATITGDPKALGHSTTLAGLVLRALAFRLGAARPRTTDDRRDLWDRSGIIADDLASRVLVLNLAASGDGLGEWLDSARVHGTPFYVTLQQLVTLPLTVTPGQHVHACENPVVLRRAAAALGGASQPLLCTEGQPSTAFHRVAAAVTGAGGEISYHGDFDWPGMAIAASVISRYGARAWRLSATDYTDAIRQRDDQPTLTGAAQPTPWDPALAEAMAMHGHAIHEEAVSGYLVADLAAPTPRHS
jgi:uncharacterized protein (TIGR02679 family)